MPGWLEVLLGIAGGLNIVGLASWAVKSIYDLRARIGLVEASVASIRQSCVLCDSDKREIFHTLKRLDRVCVALATKMGIDMSEYSES
jgi:hypothetical protein